MYKVAIIGAVFFALSIVMTMVGRGGGNFYVLTLVLAGIPMHDAALTGQFVLFATALAASFVFHKSKALSFPLFLFMGGITLVMAFAGGFLAQHFTGREMKIIFSLLLVVAGIMMLFQVDERRKQDSARIGFWNLKSGDDIYPINLWLTVPIAVASGFFAGMVGVSGGSFLVPLMVLACGVPMRIAVGTASAMVASTAFAGFIGHTMHESFNPALAVPLAAVTIIGGIIGSRIALKTKPKTLKLLFAVTTLLAAVLMLVNIYMAKQ
ncbi:sulfite exporter TauE/SafE family protein [bacterium]|nr:sulfite exporter TauE/SafE family protein [bacterium]